MKEDYRLYSKEKLIELLEERDHALELAQEQRILYSQEIKRLENSEATMRVAEERFRAISESSLNSICILNLTGKIIWANAACEQLSGYTIPQIYSAQSFVDFLAPESVEFVITNFGDFVANKEYIHSYRFYIIRSDGEKRLCEKYMTHYIDQNGERHMIISMIDMTEQNKAQEELISSETELNNAQEIAKMGSWNFDLQTLKYSWSRTNYIMLGMVPFEIDVTVEMFMHMVHPDDRERLDLFIKGIIQSKEQGTIDIRVQLPNGEIIWLQNVVVPTIINNEVVAIKGVNLNITEQKINEERIKELNATLEEKIKRRTQQLSDTNRELIQRTNELENFFNLSLDLLCIGDLKGNLLKVSNSWEILLGYPKEEIEGSNFFRYVHPEDVERTIAALNETKEKPNLPHFFTNRHVKKNGEPAILEWQTFPVGELVYAAGRNITERKKIEAEIKISQERLSNVIEATKVGTWEWEVQTGKIFFNDQWAEMLGYSLLEISPTTIDTWKNLSHPDDLIKAQDQLNAVFAGQPIDYDVDVRMKHKNGEWKWIQTKGKVVSWGDDAKPIFMSGTHTDISARKKAEEELIRAKNEAEKANQAKSEFLSRMSHELRTPMNSILGFAQLLELAELTTKQKKAVNHIIKSGKHLLTLINEVLDISRIEAGGLSLSVEPVQVNRVIHEIVDLIKPMADEQQISIRIQPEGDDLLFVYADVQRLKQVLVNLLNNAVKYNRPSGEIFITIKPGQGRQDARTYYRISVSDTGVGIKRSDLDKLFIPFERVGREKSTIEGTGLGLAVVKKLVEAMNGRVGVESTFEVGSTFWIELPQSKNVVETLRTEQLKEAQTKKTDGKGVVLYIEDNLSNVELVEQILAVQRPEIRLVTTQYGMQTLPFALEYQPNLILLDLNLPDIHGIEVLQKILNDDRVKSIPIVVVSADAMPNQISRLLKAGAVDYLQKPIDVGEFLSMVDRFMST